MVKAALANSAWWLAAAPAYTAFAAALDDPFAAQEQILLHNLRANADTAFGRAHGFADIHSVKQYARRVPVRDYDELRPWIERVRSGEPAVLTRELVKRLVPTSGSTAARKLIPWTASMQRELNCAISPWIFDLFRQYPPALAGPSYWSISPSANEPKGGDSSTAVPIGFDDDADYLSAWRKQLVDWAMAVPGDLKRIRSIDAWRYVTLLMLLRRRDLTLISIWHPSFLQLLLNALPPNWDRLLRDMADGTCAAEADLPPRLLPLLRLRPDPRRSLELGKLDPIHAAALWPRLSIISCWSDANAANAADGLRAMFPDAHVQGKGLLATEGVVSIPYEGQHPLAIHSHFLEFQDAAGRVLLASELQTECSYSVLLTTMGGLYRYRLHDLIRVDGRISQTPSIRFAGKMGLVSDRMGEKLTEGFVADALGKLLSRHGMHPTFAMLAPNQSGEGYRYTLYLNAALPIAAADELDGLLSANPQYEYCRRLQQLLPPNLFHLEGDPYAIYCDRLLKTGRRLGDIKPAALSPLDGWSECFTTSTSF